MNGRFRQLGRSDSGQSLVEFSLVLPMILLVFFGIFEMGRFYHTRLTLQHAVREAARFAVTGETRIDPATGEPMTRASSIVQVILDNARQLDVDVDAITLDPADGGGPEELVRVSVELTYELTLPLVKGIVPDNTVHLSYMTAMRNEPFYQPAPPDPFASSTGHDD